MCNKYSLLFPKITYQKHFLGSRVEKSRAKKKNNKNCTQIGKINFMHTGCGNSMQSGNALGRDKNEFHVLNSVSFTEVTEEDLKLFPPPKKITADENFLKSKINHPLRPRTMLGYFLKTSILSCPNPVKTTMYHFKT